MKIRKLGAVLLTGVIVSGLTAGVSSASASPAPQPLEVAAQNETVILGELNGFYVTGGRGDIQYQIAGADGVYETVKTTTDFAVAYRCNELGKFSVRVVSDGKTSSAAQYEVVEDGGDTFGSSPFGERYTHNVDLSHDIDDPDEPAYIEHKYSRKISDEYAFIKNVKTRKFVLTATIDILGNNGQDQNPKAGIFAKAGKNMYYFAFDAKPTFTGNTVVFVTYDPSNGWKWNSSQAFVVDAPFRSGEDRLTNSITMVREGEYFWFYVNGNYVGKTYLQGVTAETSVGTYTMAQNAMYFGYSCYTAGTPEYSEALADAKTH